MNVSYKCDESSYNVKITVDSDTLQLQALKYMEKLWTAQQSSRINLVNLETIYTPIRLARKISFMTFPHLPMIDSMAPFDIMCHMKCGFYLQFTIFCSTRKKNKWDYSEMYRQ
jgi:hypothetical protein